MKKTPKMPGKLTGGSIKLHICRMALPMLGGILAMSIFNLTDTYFIAKLGTEQLAAISFTFPVVMIIGAVAMGLGMGAESVISRYIGKGRIKQLKRFVTDSILLGMLAVGIFAILGLLTMEPLFHLLGATDAQMPMIKSYMILWYSCVAVTIIPTLGNSCIRATGDTFTPGMMMVVLAVLNVLLDPVFIFGLFGFPAMGIFGASLATVLSMGIGIFISLYILTRRSMMDWQIPEMDEMLLSWRRILYIAAPVAGTHMVMPLTSGFITKLMAAYGVAAVAASGAGWRALGFLYMLPIAVGSVLVPIIGQNSGAGKTERSWEALKTSYRFSIYYNMVCFLICMFWGEEISRIFSTDPRVVRIMAVFLLIMHAQMGMIHVCVHSEFALNALGKPMYSMRLNFLRNLLLIIPLSYLGGYYFGLWGIFGGMALAQGIAGLAAWVWLGRMFRKKLPADNAEILDMENKLSGQEA